MTYASLIQETQSVCPWCGEHMGWMMGGWFGGLFWLAILALLFALVWKIARGAPQQGGTPQEPSAKEILRQRYAKGEIDEEVFRRIMNELEK
jgi:putative membrane protein